MIIKLLKKLLFIIHKHKYKVYESIDFLPIWNFKQAEKDLRYLIKNIDYEYLPNVRLDLNKTWNSLKKQYIQEGLGEEYNTHCLQVLNIINYRYKRLFLKNTIAQLSIINDPETIKIIRSLGYKFDDSSESKYYDSLIDLQRQISGLERQIYFKTSELNKKSEEKSEEQPLEETIIHLSRFNGINYDEKTLSVKKFILLVKDFHKANKPKDQWQKVG